MAFGSGHALVTGGAGFLGSNLVRRLLALGRRVVVLDAMVPGSGANPANLADVREQLTGWVEADLADRLGWVQALEGASVVFHLAAQTGHVSSMTHPLDDLRANAAATLQLLDAMRGAAPEASIVFTSTRQVYGRPQSLPVTESHPLAPPDVNAVHKLAAEEYLRVFGRTERRAGVILRLTNTYGPRMRVCDARQTFVGHWVRLALDGEDIPLYGDGTQLRDLTYVEDCVEALLAAVSLASPDVPTYNLGGETVALRDIGEAVIRSAGVGSYRLVPFPPERQRIDIGSYRADDTAFRAATGWAPSIAFADGIERTIDYYRTRRNLYW
jgi:UDP-glucose 4-epimerase